MAAGADTDRWTVNRAPSHPPSSTEFFCVAARFTVFFSFLISLYCGLRWSHLFSKKKRKIGRGWWLGRRLICIPWKICCHVPNLGGGGGNSFAYNAQPLFGVPCGGEVPGFLAGNRPTLSTVVCSSWADVYFVSFFQHRFTRTRPNKIKWWREWFVYWLHLKLVFMKSNKTVHHQTHDWHWETVRAVSATTTLDWSALPALGQTPRCIPRAWAGACGGHCSARPAAAWWRGSATECSWHQPPSTLEEGRNAPGLHRSQVFLGRSPLFFWKCWLFCLFW